MTTCLVDCDDEFRVLHTSKVLNRARNTNRYVEFRRNDFAGLTDLKRIVGVSCIDCRPGCAHCGTKHIRQRIQCRFECLRILESATARHNPASDPKIRAIQLDDGCLYVSRWTIGNFYGVQSLELCMSAVTLFSRGECCRPNSKKLEGDRCRCPNCGDGIPGVNWAHENGAVVLWMMFDRGDVGDCWNVEPRCDARKNRLGEGRVRGSDVCK
jgi:hypothetical protein